MQASLPDSGGQPSVREELQSPLAGPQVQEQPTAAITSYEVNALLHNYLQETGLSHTAFALRNEAALDHATSSQGNRLLDLPTPPNYLIRLLHKGLLYVEAEARWRGDDTTSKPPSLLGYDLQDHLPISRVVSTKPLPELQAPEPFSTKPTAPTSYGQLTHSTEPLSRPSNTYSAPLSAETTANGSRRSSNSPQALSNDIAMPTKRSASPPINHKDDMVRAESPAALSQPSPHHTTSLQLDLPPLSGGSSIPESNKRKDRAAFDTESKSHAMEIDRPSSAQSNKKNSRDASNDQRDASPNDAASEALLRDARDKKRPKLDLNASIPPAPAPASASLSASASRAEAFSPSASLSNTAAKTPIPQTPSTAVPPVSVVTVRTVQSQKQPPHAQTLAAQPGSQTSNTLPPRRRSISPNVPMKAAQQRDSSRPNSSSGPRACSPETHRKKPSASAPPVSNGPHRKGIGRSKTSTDQKSNGDRNSRDNSPANSLKASQAAEPLRKGRGNSPIRGEVPISDCITLHGHTQTVTPCEWNPKVSKKLATGARDGTARIWAVPLGTSQTDDETRVVKHVQNKRFEITVVAWNPDGTLLATGSEDGMVRLWTPPGELCLVLAMHQRSITAIKWHKSGTMLLSSSQDSTVCLWELSTGRVRQQFETHGESVVDCDWFDEQYFASCSTDRSIHLCSINRHGPLQRLRGHTDEVNSVKFDPSKSLLASCSDDRTVRVWSMKTYLPKGSHSSSASDAMTIDNQDNGGAFVLQGHSDDVHSIAWDPFSGSNGRPRILASASFDQTARIWDADKGQCLFVLDRCTDTVYSLSFTPLDGKFLALGSNDSSVCVYRVEDGELLYEYKHTGPVYEAQWHPTLPYVAVTGSSTDVRVVPFNLS